MRVSPRFFSCLFLLPSLLLSGCGGSFQSTGSPSSVQGAALHGLVRGGQSPVSGAAIYLFAASTTGYGTPSTSLLQSGSPGVVVDGLGRGYVTSRSTGAFTITGDYTCPSGAALVYMVALGGNPGLSGNATNPALAEAVALGPCSGLTPPRTVAINEVTTVAAMSALAPFTDPVTTNISTSTTNVLGLTNAFVTANNLVSTYTGQPNTATPSGIGAVPYMEINTLADILAACVNSNGGAGTPCATLFTATTIDGVAPTNTLQAMLNITRRPAQNVHTLYTMATATAPFQPTLPVQYDDFARTYDGTPNDWSIAIAYTSPSFGTPNFLAIDSQSNVWSASGQYETAAQLSNAGVLTHVLKSVGNAFDVNNYNRVLAIDLSDNLWIDLNSYGITKVSSSGGLVSPDTNWSWRPGPGTNNANLAQGYPTDFWLAGYGGIAISPANEPWAGSASNALSALVHLDSSGRGVDFFPGVNSGVNNPTSVVFDPFGNIWLPNYSGAYGNTVSKVSSTGAPLSGTTGFAAGTTPLAIAFDHVGNAWIANINSQTVTVLSNLGVPLPFSPLSGGGLLFPTDIAVDGAGNFWLSNINSSGVTEFNGLTGAALSPTYGFYSGTETGRQMAVAIDASGNVWTSNWGNGTINEIVGIAAPTVTPLVLAQTSNKIGLKP